MTERAQRWVIAATLFVTALTVYLYNLPYRYWGAGGDTTPAELLPLTLFSDGDLFFDEFVKPGEALPFWFTPVQGRIVSSYPIVPGFFNVPTYLIAKKAGMALDSANRSRLSMISASVVCATSVVFFYFAALHWIERRTAILAALVYAFGTTVFSVAARGMWQHGPSLLFIAIAFWLLSRATTWSLALSGLFLGLAVFNRPTNILLALPIAILIGVRQSRKTTAAFVAFAAIPATLLFWYSYVHWGSFRNLGQYSVTNTPYAFNLFELSRFSDGLPGLLFSPSRGLLVFTPLFLLSFVAIARLLRHPTRQPFLTALATGVLSTIVLYATWYSWWGGTSFGYRLLTELVPALVLMAAWHWETSRRRGWVTALATVGLIVSLYVNYLGAYYYPCGFNTIPNDINAHPERLWSFHDGEIVRCSTKLFARIESRF